MLPVTSAPISAYPPISLQPIMQTNIWHEVNRSNGNREVQITKQISLYDKMNNLFNSYRGQKQFSLKHDEQRNKQELIKLEMSLARLDKERRVVLQSSHRLYVKDQLRNLKKDVILSFMCDQTAGFIKDRQKFKRFWDKNQELCQWLLRIQNQFRRAIPDNNRKNNITILQRPKPNQSENQPIKIKRNPHIKKHVVDGQPAFGNKPMAKQSNNWIKPGNAIAAITNTSKFCAIISVTQLLLHAQYFINNTLQDSLRDIAGHNLLKDLQRIYRWASFGNNQALVETFKDMVENCLPEIGMNHGHRELNEEQDAVEILEKMIERMGNKNEDMKTLDEISIRCRKCQFAPTKTYVPETMIRIQPNDYGDIGHVVTSTRINNEVQQCKLCGQQLTITNKRNVENLAKQLILHLNRTEYNRFRNITKNTEPI